MNTEHLRQDLMRSLLQSLTVRVRSIEARTAILPQDGEPGPQGERGAQGETGPEGARGSQGDMPRHRWDGTSLQFQQGPDGNVWGASVDLQGPAGKDGKGGAIIGGGTLRVFGIGMVGFVPAPTSGDAGKFLRADATWQTASGTSSFGYMPQGWT